MRSVEDEMKIGNLNYKTLHIDRLRFIVLFYVKFTRQGHAATGSLWVEEPEHTS